jgi:hypothetical protein
MKISEKDNTLTKLLGCDAELNLKGRIGTESDESWLMVKPANKHLQASTAI